MKKLRVAYNANTEAPKTAKPNKRQIEVQDFIREFLADHNEKIQKKDKQVSNPKKR